jgi:hypothetical protein
MDEFMSTDVKTTLPVTGVEEKSAPLEGVAPQQIFEVWKQAVDLQKHFNDILLRIRNFYFLYFGVVVAGISSSLGKDNSILTALKAHLSFWTYLAAITPALALYFLDRFYYHELLRGAVMVAKDIEKKYSSLNMASRIQDVNHNARLFWIVRTGRRKVTVFYALPLIVGAAVLGNWLWALGMLTPFFVLEWSAERVPGKLSES